MFLELLGLAVVVATAIYLVKITAEWLRMKLEEMRAIKVCYEDIDRTIRNCKSNLTREDLRKLREDGYTNVLYATKSDGTMDVEIIKHKGNDAEIEERMKRNDGMTVIQG